MVTKKCHMMHTKLKAFISIVFSSEFGINSILHRLLLFEENESNLIMVSFGGIVKLSILD